RGGLVADLFGGADLESGLGGDGTGFADDPLRDLLGVLGPQRPGPAARGGAFGRCAPCPLPLCGRGPRGRGGDVIGAGGAAAAPGRPRRRFDDVVGLPRAFGPPAGEDPAVPVRSQEAVLAHGLFSPIPSLVVSSRC